MFCKTDGMTLKRCGKCGEDKPHSEFHRQRGHKDGLASYCKKCNSDRAKAWAQANPERTAARMRQWSESHRESSAERSRRRRQSEPERVAKMQKAYKERNPEKARAHDAVNKAVARGKLLKPNSCEECNKPTEHGLLHGHHEDYSKPLEVEWLCAACHQKRHLK